MRRITIKISLLVTYNRPKTKKQKETKKQKMGNTISPESIASIRRIHFEDMQRASSTTSCIILNTFPESEQQCTIRGTISANEECSLLNRILEQKKMSNVCIIIYGKNCNDDTIFTKYAQLQKLGFRNVAIYTGGLFEWLLLQDVYGAENFPTSCNSKYAMVSRGGGGAVGTASHSTIPPDPISYGLAGNRRRDGFGFEGMRFDATTAMGNSGTGNDNTLSRFFR